MQGFGNWSDLRRTGASQVSVTGPPQPDAFHEGRRGDKRARESDDEAPSGKRARPLPEDTWADVDPNRRMGRPIGMPEDDGANSVQLREPFKGTPETIFAMPSERTDAGHMACKICADSENEQFITNELVRACSNGRGIEVAISVTREQYEKQREETKTLRSGVNMPEFARADFQYHAATCVQHDSVQNAISLSVMSVFARALASTASNGTQANGLQLPHHGSIKDYVNLQRTMMDTRAAQ